MKLHAFFLLLTILAPMPLHAAPAIIGHRGASSAAPENTLASIREAWKQKADGAEFDIRLTKDGKIVLMHDDTTKRTTGSQLVVKNHSLAELRELDAGSWKGEQWRGEPVPLLEEVLKDLPEGKIYYIEIKSGPEILPELARLIKESGKASDQFRIIAFDFDTLVKSESLIPTVKTLWIVDGKKDNVSGKKTYPDLAGLADKAAGAGIEGLNLNHGFPLDEAAVKAIKAKGLSVAAWTVNDPAIAKRLATAGLDALSTDLPGKIRAEMKPWDAS
ncbi:MAG: glycerophosphodiester phosphodiesterase [Verrucomicrobiaceae bacterium]|nr:MAG: glycerophosphodiester phosphodiesterase [Verrucomicrobiaceae bacterium]